MFGPIKMSVILVSSDNKYFTVDASCARKSMLISIMMEEEVSEIPLPNVSGEILEIVVEFLNLNTDFNIPKPLELPLENYISKDVSSFISKVPFKYFSDLILAANYIDMAPLMYLVVAKMKNKEKYEGEKNDLSVFPKEIQNLFKEY